MSKKISEDKLDLEVPKEIRELAQGFRRQRVKKEQAERLEKQKRETEQKRVHATRLKKGLRYATKVFVWANALKESAIGQELMKKSYSRITFFDDHIVGVPWVGLVISPNGLFLTSGGRGGFLFDKPMSSPENLAESVHTVILEAACVWIDNGEVWNCIKRHLSHSKK